ncbi:alpha/beta hydrolase [Microlunatus soli]|uniref:Alpha/beta hydrolase fold n=1 Tax=Microlunatus soli TaxID=630515 RepID=A0A1H1VVP5_9ACTN|nr:alpha/beta hydrolase [Microlunatus soli]SDS88813.1 alpha/beta hydrolase fold [Microlunatus soli]
MRSIRSKHSLSPSVFPGIPVAAAIAALIIPALSATPHADQASAEPRPAAPISWQSCPATAGTATDAGSTPQCARLPVPLDHDHPEGRTIGLALVRHPATGASRGTIVVNAGTQAGGGTAFVSQYGQQLFGRLNKQFDIVGVDTRGTGQSVPAVRCTTHEQDRAIEAPIPAFQSTADRPTRLAEATKITQRCQERSGSILPYLSTTADARDLDIVRTALGEQRLRYIGVSNGTLLGQEYADRFPDRVGAMVLDSPLDISEYMNHPLRFDRDQMVASEHTLQTFLSWCADNPQSCSFGGDDPRQAFERLVMRMEDNRKAHPERDDIVTGGNLLQYVLGQLIFPSAWPDLAKTLAAMESQPLPLAPLQHGENTVLAEFLSHACLDKRLPEDLRAYDRQLRAASRVSPHFGSMFGYGQLKCRQWPAEPVDRNDGPWTHTGTGRTLVVIGTDDPLAPASGAVRVRNRAHAASIQVAGSGHMQLGKTPCVDSEVADFFLGRAVPRRASCSVPLPTK